MVTLRFRNDSSLRTVGHWRTIAYNWGSKSNGGSQARYYEWPSLTQFPMMSPITLKLPYGALVWYRTKTPYPPTNGPSEQWLYQYGQISKTQLPNGQYPTMTLVPYRSTNAFTQSSVLYRGDTTTQTTSPGVRGYSSRHYPLMLENRPDIPSPAFTGSVVRSDSVRAEFVIRKPIVNDCNVAYLKGDGYLYDGDHVKNVFQRPTPPDVDDGPGLPLSFFASPTDGATDVESLEDAAEVTRSSVFTAGSVPRYVNRRVMGTDELMQWLNAAPLDHGDSADVKIMVELVQASNDEVLWSADTISARQLGEATQEDIIEVPVQMVTTPENEVYIRMRAEASMMLEYELSAAFTFEDDTTTQHLYQKVLRPRTEKNAGPGATLSKLEVGVIPNPMTTQGELWLRVTEPGQTTVGIYDMMGRIVKSLPAFDAISAGEYALGLDLTALPKGMYTARIVQGKYQATSRFAVMR
jgi:hypothetical protein